MPFLKTVKVTAAAGATEELADIETAVTKLFKRMGCTLVAPTFVALEPIAIKPVELAVKVPGAPHTNCKIEPVLPVAPVVPVVPLVPVVPVVPAAPVAPVAPVVPAVPVAPKLIAPVIEIAAVASDEPDGVRSATTV